MKKVFKNLICIGLVLVLSTGIAFATPDDDGGGGMEVISSKTSFSESIIYISSLTDILDIYGATLLKIIDIQETLGILLLLRPFMITY